MVEVFDLILALLYVLFFLIFASGRKKKEIDAKPYYKFYTTGLLVKFIGVLSFCLIYLIYYGGGDTTNYFLGVKSAYNLLLQSPVKYFDFLLGDNDGFTWSFFNSETGFPPHYMFRDDRTFLVIKVTSIIGILGFGKFITTSVLLAGFTYRWIWLGFTVVADRYPKIVKQNAMALLMVPSVVFWGSGIMKDTYSLAATFFLFYGFIQIFVVRKKVLVNLIQSFVAIFLIVSIKSYILFALLPGLLIFVNFERIASIKSIFLKIVIVPVSITLIFVVVQYLFIDLSDIFGRYSADRLLEEAAIQQQDLKRDAYGSNSFDIGEFEPTLSGALSKFPQAVNAALFRPYITEVGSPTMMLSGIENIIMLLVTVYFLLLLGPFRFFRLLFKDPYLIFVLLFTLILGFGVGLSTSNFGALVRYKIPFVPFYVSMLFIVNHYRKSKKTNV